MGRRHDTRRGAKLDETGAIPWGVPQEFGGPAVGEVRFYTTIYSTDFFLHTNTY